MSTPLGIAVKHGYYDAVALLLDKGAYADGIHIDDGYRYYDKPLYTALALGHDNIALLLISKGASTDINFINRAFICDKYTLIVAKRLIGLLYNHYVRDQVIG